MFILRSNGLMIFYKNNSKHNIQIQKHAVLIPGSWETKDMFNKPILTSY